MTQLEEDIFGEVPRKAGSQPAAGQGAKPPRRTWQTLLALVLSIVVLGGGGFFGYQLVKPIIADFTATEDYPGPGTGTVNFIVSDGESGRTIGQNLVKAGVIKTTDGFISASGDRPELARAIQPGTYSLKHEMTSADALEMIGNPENRIVARVTVPEGLWASEVYERLSKATDVPIKNYVAAAKKPKNLGLPAAAGGNVEGWLFPSTYEFPPKASAAQQLTILVKQAVTVMKKSGVPEADWQKTLILASIIESEAGSDEDRPKVARVFINRLETSGEPTYGKLQSDATVSYGAKRRAVVPTEKEINDDNPYNTRLHTGLPAGPISNPGEASILAAARPAEGSWFFFVTVDPFTGETKFATTLAEHNKNVEEFVAWCKEHKDQC